MAGQIPLYQQSYMLEIRIKGLRRIWSHWNFSDLYRIQFCKGHLILIRITGCTAKACNLIFKLQCKYVVFGSFYLKSVQQTALLSCLQETYRFPFNDVTLTTCTHMHSRNAFCQLSPEIYMLLGLQKYKYLKGLK